MTDDAEILLARMAAMVPDLRARGRAAEQAGRIPDATIAELDQAGAFRAVVPECYGGLELDFPVIPQILRIMGQGCVATAWTMGFLIYHNFQFAHFPEKAQKEVWSGRGYTMAPGHIMPSGSAVPVDGGYQVSGQWGYATGILHADWVLFSAPVTGHGKNATPDLRRFYVPVEDCEIVDGWDVSTMAATGSYDMALDDTFIPEYRQVKIADVIAQTSPGLAINQGPLWRMPFISFTSLIAVAPMIGGAEAMFALTSDILKTKVGAQSGIVQQAAMAQQIRMARIQMTIKSMLALWENALDFVWEKTVSGAPLTMEERAEARVIAAHAAKICDQAANELAVAAGSRGIFNDAPLQRFRREINALATHAFFDYDHLASLYGGTLLGADLPPHAMI